MGVPKHLKSSDSRALIWKNGKGTTSEIAIDPEGANFATEPFSWRLSSASVLQSGPFSEFPGYDRYLVLIEGDPICLQFMESGEQVFL